MTHTKYVIIDNDDPYVKEVQNPVTGTSYFAKIALNGREIDDLRAASALEFPADFNGILSIPKLVSEDADILPPECAAWDPDLVMIMEAAKGQELLAMERPRDGSPKAQIYESDWQNFCKAVHYMNAQGVVHGDIQNTSNIFIRQDENGHTTFELIDWGGPAKGKAGNDLADLETVENAFRRDGLLIPDPSVKPESGLSASFSAQLGVNASLSGDTFLGDSPVQDKKQVPFSSSAPRPDSP